MASPRRLTDEQLANATLDVVDPMAVEKLSLERPDQDLPPQIVGEYHLPTDAERIWCCHCQTYRPWNGFVIENETGRRYLIGSHCGPKHYHLSFTLAKRQHSELRARQGVLERLRRIQALEGDISDAMRAVFQSEALRSVARKRAEMKLACRHAHAALTSAANSGVGLFETARVRDYEAEQRRDRERKDTLAKDEDREQPLWTFENRPLGAIEGSELLRTQGDCRDKLLALRTALADVRPLRGKATEAIGTRKLTAQVRAVEDALSQAQSAVDAVRAAPSFFSPSNLNRIERWSQFQRRFDLYAEDGNLIVRSETDPGGTIQPLGKLDVPSLPTLDERKS